MFAEANLKKSLIAMVSIFALLLTAISFPAAFSSQEYELERNTKAFNYLRKYFQSAESAGQRSEGLFRMYQSDMIATFPYLLECLKNDSIAVKTTAAKYIGSYFVKTKIFAGNELLVKLAARNDEISSKRGEVIEILKGIKNTNVVDLKLNALYSIARMGEADSFLVNEVYDIALGKDIETWEFAGDIKYKSDKERRDGINHAYRSRALKLLLSMKKSNLYSKMITSRMIEIFDDPSVEPEFFLEFKRLINMILGIPKIEELEQGTLKSSGTGDCRSSTKEVSWFPVQLCSNDRRSVMCQAGYQSNVWFI